MLGNRATCAGIACALGLVGSAHAGSIVLGSSGWQASWDPSLDGRVQIVLDAVTADTVLIQKLAEFTQGPGIGGIYPPVIVTFQQIAPTSVRNIVIADEVLTNSTGTTWTDFHMTLVDHGDATFNPTSTFGSGFTYNPFSNLVFSPDNTQLDLFGGGTVPNGGTFGPGIGNGELYINVNPSSVAPFTTFSLKEFPTPEPTTLVLLGLGAAFIRRR